MDCYHCGLPVPKNSLYLLSIQGKQQPMCCPGCLAVASAICEGGLAKFYQFRTEDLNKPEEPSEDKFSAFELPEVADTFITKTPEGLNEVCLLVGGITCAACTWLIEKYFAALSFVYSVNVNLSAHRATIVWHPDQGSLADILKAFTAIGYQATPMSDGSATEMRKKEARQSLLRLGVAGIGMMQAGMLAVALYAGALQGMDAAMESFLRWVSLVFATPVVFYAGWPFLRSAWRSVRMSSLTMDVPVSMAILIAWSASVWATVSAGGEVYFDSMSMFIFFLLLGRFLEMRVRHNNALLGEGVSQGLPMVAERVQDGQSELVPISQIQIADNLRVASGEVFPADGVVAQGEGEVDESLISGEQKPVLKKVGSAVLAGSVNGSNPLMVKVLATGTATRFSTIMHLVERAQSEKPTQQMMADKLSAYFVAAVLIIASCVGLAWWFVSPEKMLWVVLSVLVVTCPCALSLATPTALAVASKQLRRWGFLVTRGHVLETLAQSDKVVFDKTGTLTLGEMEIADVIVLSDTPKAQLLRLASTLELGLNHPIAKVFSQFEHVEVESIKHHLGEGVSGIFEGQAVAIGKPNFVVEFLGLSEVPDQPLKDGQTCLLMAAKDAPLAWLVLQDSLRDGVTEVLSSLIDAGLSVELMSGDHPETVRQVSQKVGVTHFRGGCSPEDKLHLIRNYQRHGDKVVMVGDGINDIPVLSGADVSIAVGDASDLTRIHADSILLTSDFGVLNKAFVLARETRKIIRQNMAWALIYNLLALPLAALGLVPPWAAAIGMSASSMLVVVNALRLQRRGVN